MRVHERPCPHPTPLEFEEERKKKSSQRKFGYTGNAHILSIKDVFLLIFNDIKFLVSFWKFNP